MSNGIKSVVSTALVAACAVGGALFSPTSASAADWSVTELQYQGGRLKNPFLNTKEYTNVLTIDHASGYSWGDFYFFADFINDEANDGFNDDDVYTEAFAWFSSAKILKAQYSGVIKDVGVFGSINYGADSNYLLYLAGAYVDWNIPGFSFLRSYISVKFDDSNLPFGAGKDQTGLHADTIWAYPFEVANQRFLFQGHMEWMQLDHNELVETRDWFLTQPQLRWDVGYALTGRKDVVHIGTEYQLWINKFGTDVNESAFQAFMAWRF